jgi:hypothetical protein
MLYESDACLKHESTSTEEGAKLLGSLQLTRACCSGIVLYMSCDKSGGKSKQDAVDSEQVR